MRVSNKASSAFATFLYDVRPVVARRLSLFAYSDSLVRCRVLRPAGRFGSHACRLPCQRCPQPTGAASHVPGEAHVVGCESCCPRSPCPPPPAPDARTRSIHPVERGRSCSSVNAMHTHICTDMTRACSLTVTQLEFMLWHCTAPSRISLVPIKQSCGRAATQAATVQKDVDG